MWVAGVDEFVYHITSRASTVSRVLLLPVASKQGVRVTVWREDTQQHFANINPIHGGEKEHLIEIVQFLKIQWIIIQKYFQLIYFPAFL